MNASEMCLGLAIAEKHDGGETAHVVLSRKLYIILFAYFETGKFDGAFECLDGLVKLRSKSIAGSTPIASEINQYRNLARAFDYLSMEFLLVNIEYEA